MPRPENSERQGQEYPAAAKRHGNVRPEKHLTPAIQDGDEAGQKHDEKHGQLIHRQHLPVIGHAAERHDHIACDHRTDAEREPADPADQRQDDAAHGQTPEERMHLIDEVGRKHHDRLYIRIQSLHIEADRDRRQTNGNDDGCRKKAARRCSGRRIRRENALDICLRTEYPHEDGEKIRQCRLCATPEEGKLSSGKLTPRSSLMDRLKGFPSCDEKSHPDDPHFQHTADPR